MDFLWVLVFLIMLRKKWKYISKRFLGLFCLLYELKTMRTLDLVKTNQYGNGTAIFTRDGDTARDFANKVNVGMVGVNVPIPVPLAYHTFGGWKKSAFGDLNQHGPDAFRFYTKTKTVTSRWPTGIKEGASFSIPTME